MGHKKKTKKLHSIELTFDVSKSDWRLIECCAAVREQTVNDFLVEVLGKGLSEELHQLVQEFSESFPQNAVVTDEEEDDEAKAEDFEDLPPAEAGVDVSGEPGEQAPVAVDTEESVAEEPKPSKKRAKKLASKKA